MNSGVTTVFFIDRCLGRKQIAEALRNLGITAEVHDDHFPKEALDTEWLPEVGKRGWIVLTKDDMIAKRNLEKLAVVNAKIKMFVLSAKQLSGNEMANVFTKAVLAMQNFAISYPAPFIAKVHRNGDVVEWKNSQDLLVEVSRLLNP